MAPVSQGGPLGIVTEAKAPLLFAGLALWKPNPDVLESRILS